jgi:ADP-ribose pyrophosphatase YjhB (NUDIX family)
MGSLENSLLNIDRPEPLQKRPADAEKVFSGVMFDVYQWSQKLFDGSEATFEVLKRPDTVNVIAVTPEKKLIVITENQPGRERFTTIPGGRVDRGEHPHAAAKRELLEETGMISDDWQLLSAQQVTSKIDWAVFNFIARGCRYVEEQQLDAGERMEVREVSFDEFTREVTTDNFPLREIMILFQRALLEEELMQKLRLNIL